MKHVNETMPDVQRRAPRRLVGARRGGRARDREGPRGALPRHERVARRPRGRPRGRGRPRRALDRRGDHRARLGVRERPAPATRRRVSWAGVLLARRGRGGGDRDRRRSPARRDHASDAGGGERQRRSRSRSTAATDYDPDGGDGRSTPTETALAIDGNPATRPGRPRPTTPPASRAISKDGVGLILDAGEPGRRPSSRLQVTLEAGLGRRRLRLRLRAARPTSPAGAHR